MVADDGQKKVKKLGDDGGEKKDGVKTGMVGAGKSRATSGSLKKKDDDDDEEVEASRRKISRLEETVGSLEAEVRKLKGTIARSRQIFGKQFVEFERMERILAKLQKEEIELPGTIDKKKEALCEMNCKNGRKEELVRKLKKKLARRQQNPVAISMERQGPDMKPGERRDAVDICLEEIWELIFGNLEDSQDLWNCYNTFRLFQTILHQWKTTWAYEQALPYLFPYLPGEKLLECRVVSKGWKEKVDQFLQNHPSLGPHNAERCNPRTLPFIQPLEEKGLFGDSELVLSDEMVPDFEQSENFKQVRAKLLVGRAANITITNVEEEDEEEGERGNGNQAYEQVWENVHKFFRSFGELIWYLRLEVKFSENTVRITQKIYQFLKDDLARLAPSLRRLRLGVGPSLVFRRDDWTCYPFLETLEVDEAHCRSYSPFLWPFLEAHHAQLKKISLKAWLWKNLPCRDWPNLTELYLMTALGAMRPLASLEYLLSLAVPNLSKLTLDSDGAYFSNSTYLCRFLEILESLTRTTRLKTLRLVLLEGIHNNVLLEPEPYLDLSSELPKLTTLELEFRSLSTIPDPNFQFLLYFPYLENLHIFGASHMLRRRVELLSGQRTSSINMVMMLMLQFL